MAYVFTEIRGFGRGTPGGLRGRGRCGLKGSRFRGQSLLCRASTFPVKFVLELDGGEVADRRMDPQPVVIHLDVLEHPRLEAFKGVERWRWTNSFFRVAQNDSAAALSKQIPVRPTEFRTPLILQNLTNSLLVYWLPGRRGRPHLSRVAAELSPCAGRNR